jgi:hypothetical protein
MREIKLNNYLQENDNSSFNLHQIENLFKNFNIILSIQIRDKINFDHNILEELETIIEDYPYDFS